MHIVTVYEVTSVNLAHRGNHVRNWSYDWKPVIFAPKHYLFTD